MNEKILLADDEAGIRKVLGISLADSGYEVLTAVDGEEGLDLALSERPDLIITDFQMPYMTGLELCNALASNPETKSIPVLMLTARGYALEADDLAVGNIKDVLSKPFSPRAILAQVQSLLAEADDRGGREAA